MNTTLITPLLLLALGAAAAAQLPQAIDAPETAAEVGMLPGDKQQASTSSRLPEDARNPFATTPDGGGGLAGPAHDSQSEEARVRAVLDKFVVNGVAQSPDGSYKASMESIILKEGQVLPRLLPDQVEDIRVSKITPKLVEFTWVGDEAASAPRQVTRPVDLTPTVEISLPTPKGAHSTAIGNVALSTAPPQGDTPDDDDSEGP